MKTLTVTLDTISWFTVINSMSIIKNKRNYKIVELRALGYDMSEIGVKLGISRQRVSQILKQIRIERKMLKRLQAKLEAER